MQEEKKLNPPTLIGRKLEDLEFDIFHKNEIKKVKFEDYKGKWLILFFYPADFTFVCPTELEDMADTYEEFQKNDAEVISFSTDTVFVHKAWYDNSEAIAKIKFPMGADPTGKVAKSLGVYIDEEGLALRGSFIIDPEGVIKAYEVHDNNIGRSAKEFLRKLQAALYVAKHGGEVCPARWQPGDDTLKPGLDLVGKI
ncbi:MAG: peroxiredoxin [Parcubacteria group bacterium CG1_02_37_51]|uniref:Peroxiredoxin n=2 Tax=Candidatus Komeiliibacteriota TaxID=1817908 RepID=A0A2M8DR38_9BACT|nr:MAG: peroxiredoxin [Parcubacteria group bacterium CG1_02_37_51]PIY93751.1 MAG: peroxiredoxin [Candidatus Komeilibacteria bacterium CG_4_10_14_0_8_um_filter_37_78]PJC01827.1 MAG: peroxiredoxin [Candidatus Komeilibacteria bacterium CG_4_9_14_0_8_um_filter_36_9]